MLWLVFSRIFLFGFGWSLFYTDDIFIKTGGLFFLIGLLLDIIYQVWLTEKKDRLY